MRGFILRFVCSLICISHSLCLLGCRSGGAEPTAAMSRPANYMLFVVASSAWPDGNVQWERRYFIMPMETGFFPSLSHFTSGELPTASLQYLCDRLRAEHCTCVFPGYLGSEDFIAYNNDDGSLVAIDGIYPPSPEEMEMINSCLPGVAGG